MSVEAEHASRATEETSLLRDELKKSREREKKLEAALHEVFPIDVYTKARPDVEKSCNGKLIKILEHYIEYGIHEIDIKREILKQRPSLYDHIKEAATLLAEREQQLESALQAVALACLKNVNISQVAKQKSKQARPLSLLQTKGSLSHLQDNQAHVFAIKHTSMHYKSNSVCTWIPKNGCSNLRYSIAKENGAITDISEIEWIHRNNDCFNVSTKEALEASYTFVILRNPFRRLLSFFLDKLCHNQEDQSEMSYQQAQQVFEFHDELSFSDFINYIRKNGGSIYKDEHTTPQCNFLLYRNYDSYFSLENLKDANHKIHEETGIKLDDVRDKNSIFTSKGCEPSHDITHLTQAREIKNLLDQKKIPITEKMYTCDMIRKVSALYLQDILVYCSEIPSGSFELNPWIQKAIADE